MPAGSQYSCFCDITLAYEGDIPKDNLRQVSSVKDQFHTLPEPFGLKAAPPPGTHIQYLILPSRDEQGVQVPGKHDILKHVVLPSRRRLGFPDIENMCYGQPHKVDAGHHQKVQCTAFQYQLLHLRPVLANLALVLFSNALRE